MSGRNGFICPDYSARTRRLARSDGMPDNIPQSDAMLFSRTRPGTICPTPLSRLSKGLQRYGPHDLPNH